LKFRLGRRFLTPRANMTGALFFEGVLSVFALRLRSARQGS
jgi:hypothetical protein